MTYDLVLTQSAHKFYEKAEHGLVKRLNRCFNHIREDPRSHPNVKALRGQLSGYFRYRLGEWRIVYSVDESRRVITILLIVHRRSAY